MYQLLHSAQRRNDLWLPELPVSWIEIAIYVTGTIPQKMLHHKLARRTGKYQFLSPDGISARSTKDGHSSQANGNLSAVIWCGAHVQAADRKKERKITSP